MTARNSRTAARLDRTFFIREPSSVARSAARGGEAAAGNLACLAARGAGSRADRGGRWRASGEARYPVPVTWSAPGRDEDWTMDRYRSRTAGAFAALAALAAVGVFTAVGAAPGSGAPPAREVDVDVGAKYRQSLGAVGFRGVVLVARGGKVLLHEGSGGVSRQAAFDIASIAKSLTAVAVLRVAQRGVLSLDDPLTRFFAEVPAEKRAITVHQLLTHTAGIGNSTGDTATGVKDRAEAVRMILATPLVGPPGHGHAYSNDGYTLLAAILEVARSRSWETVMREEVLLPAGMSHTFFAGDPWPSGPGAMARAAVTSHPSGREAEWGAKGGAGIFSTAEDLMRFMNAAAGGALLGPGAAAEIGRSYAPAGAPVQSP